MRFLILALASLLILPGLSAAQEPDTVQERLASALAAHETAHEIHESDREAWLEAMAEWPPAPAPAPAPEPAPEPEAAPAAPAPSLEERLGFAVGYVNDGGCSIPSKTLTGRYTREADSHGIYAEVRTAPSGGDCERSATSFNLTVERRYALAFGWEAVAKFQADRRSTSAPYALVDGTGEVIARPDGAPSDPVTLPAGTADVVGGYLGITRAVDAFRFTIAGNVVPVSWMEGESLAAHLAIAWDHGDSFDVSASADIGRDWLGFARASWRPPVSSRIGVELSGGFAWGLNSIDGGEPAEQTFAGLPVIIQGAPRDTAITADIGITF